MTAEKEESQCEARIPKLLNRICSADAYQEDIPHDYLSRINDECLCRTGAQAQRIWIPAATPKNKQYGIQDDVTFVTISIIFYVLTRSRQQGREQKL